MIQTLKKLSEIFELLIKEFPDDSLYSYAIYVVRHYFVFFLCSYSKRPMSEEILIPTHEANLVIALFTQDTSSFDRMFFLQLIFIRLLGQLNRLPLDCGVNDVFEIIRCDEHTPELQMNPNITTTFFELIQVKSTQEAEELVSKHVPANSPWYPEVLGRIMAKFYPE